MASMLADLSKHITKPFKKVSLDDAYSRFNRIYLFTSCVVFGIIVSVNDYTGETIECHGFSVFEHTFAENYCWTQGLYTIEEGYNLPTNALPYPGILPENTPCFDFTYANGTRYECPDSSSLLPLTRVYHLWYQWIPFYFWIVAGIVYLPYMVFHNSDIGKIKPVIKLLVDSVEDEEEEKRKIEKASLWLANKLSEYMRASGPIQFVLVRHKFFFILLFSKFANLFTVLLVLFATNQIFKLGSFLAYGYVWLDYALALDQSTQTNPLDVLFPKMVACEIEKWGTTGLVNEAGMCVLAPNVVNSYFFLTFWVVLLLGVFFNIVSCLFSTTSHLFTLGRWKTLTTSTFMKGTPAEKWVFFNSGTSGQITLEIIAQNTGARMFEKVFQRATDRLARSESYNRERIYDNKQATA